MREEKDLSHVGHRARMRATVKKTGLDGLHQHQVLEYLLFQILPRQDTGELAHRLIDRFGNLEGVLSADPEEIRSVTGVGPGSAAWLKALGDMANRYADTVYERRTAVRSAAEALRFVESRKTGSDMYGTWQITLTNSGEIRSFRQISGDMTWMLPETIRDALDDVLCLHARYVIVVLFDEAEDPDRIVERERDHAQQYSRILSSIGVSLLDELIFIRDRAVSLKRDAGFGENESRSGNGSLREAYRTEWESEMSDPDR